MSNRNRNNLPNNLAQLQNLIKRDPESYREEFLQQWKHFQSNLEIFKLDPTREAEAVEDVMKFIAQVGNCYESIIEGFPETLMDILSQHYSVMNPNLRMSMCKSLILMRNKNLISPLKLLELFFKLLKAKDKLLRKTLYNHIVTDIKNVNQKSKNNKINTVLQNYMFSMLKDSSPIAAKISMDIMVELYRKNIWNDTKTVNVIVTGCYSKITKVMVTALKFFLGTDAPEEVKADSDSESEDDNEKAKKLIIAGQVSKKTGKKKRKMEKALSMLRKAKKKQKPVSFNFSAIHLINDPQGFAEKLFKQLESSTERFEVKLMMINLIGRLVGIHELILLNFYPFLQRFLQPHQREVTKLLMTSAQATHDLVPPDAIEPVLRTIANNFVSEKNSTEVMAVGLNAIREICARNSLAMSAELLQDLVEYKTTKSKTVMMAARSLIQLYRNFDSTLLRKKDRGKPQEPSMIGEEVGSKQFGAKTALTFVPGADLLDNETETKEKTKKKKKEVSEDGEKDKDSENESESGSEAEDEDNEDWETDEEEEDARAKAEQVSQTKFLTDDDFKKIQQKAISQQIESGPSAGKRGKKRKQTTAASGQEKEKSELVDLASIENVVKKMKHDKESRLATVLAGREGREKFSKPKQKRQNEHASTTNKEKIKSKPFMMISHSQRSRGKGKKSFRDKQIALRDSMLKKDGKTKSGKKRKH
ncbi:protein SDA1 homolog isoform X2 [Clytia hemisphaerica]|uniref:protein SDA1 homolog isoform X2 n=1 Tax=Clytia hemisphaerica TaxID=252671 RepID=UPI0034D68CDD